MMLRITIWDDKIDQNLFYLTIRSWLPNSEFLELSDAVLDVGRLMKDKMPIDEYPGKHPDFCAALDGLEISYPTQPLRLIKKEAVDDND